MGKKTVFVAFQPWQVLLVTGEPSVAPWACPFLPSRVPSSYFSLYSSLQRQALDLSASDRERG